jgi:GNAT superfamily N-acetyltransferase
MVYYRGQLVAYFTISFDGLKRELVKGLKSFSIPKKIDIESYPAIKVGRLAVQKEWQGKGIGSALLKYVVAYGLETRVKGGLRLIIVEAEPESKGFYEHFGFILVNQTRREKTRTHKTLFFDLGALDGVVK